ncbi:MAG: CoA-binding protein [Chloroflexi bacterium]|nr:CoA-binding protein [Chloroflexota bacterium]
MLQETKTIAVVGLSPDPGRDSHRVARYLQQAGYRVIPVNPMVPEVLGVRSYPDLASVPERIDLVDVFRRSEGVAPVVEGAIRKGARFIWMQDGVRDEASAAKARAAGILVVMDNCIMREHRRRLRGRLATGPSGADGAGAC